MTARPLAHLPEAEEIFERILALSQPEHMNRPLGRERRRFPRLDVKWSVRLSGGSGEIAAVTRDMSCRGMCFASGRWFLPGETLSCTVLIPMHDPTDSDRMLALHAKATVVRVESLSVGPPVGIACRFEECSVELVSNPHAFVEIP